MESPKCKLCGERHYGMCAVPARQESPSVEPLPVEQGAAPPPQSKGFDRTAYQREYMRKRRAALRDRPT